MKNTNILQFKILMIFCLVFATLLLRVSKTYAQCNSGCGGCGGSNPNNCCNWIYCGGCNGCGTASACDVNGCGTYSSSNPACSCCSPVCSGDRCGQSNGCGGSCSSADAGSCGKCGNGPCCSPSCGSPFCGQGDGCGGSCSSSSDTCSPACGQVNACGRQCTNASAGVPGAVTVTAPANGADVQRNGAGQVTITWTAATNATKYDLHIYPSDNLDCADPRSICKDVANGTGLSGTSFSFTPLANQLVFTIRAVNQNCNSQNAGAPWYGSWSADKSFNVTANITGRVYLDPTASATVVGSLCTMSGSPVGTQAGAGSTITVTDASGTRAPVAVAANGTYTAPSLYNGSSSLTLAPGDTTYACSCPVGCTYGGVVSPTANVNYFVTQVGRNWFQIMGGDVNGSNQSNAFIDPITTQCTVPTCQPYPLLPTVGGTTSQQGALLTPTIAGSNVDVSDQGGYQSTPVGPVGSSYSVKTGASIACKENYNYFFRLYSLGLEGTTQAPKEDFVAPANNPASAQKPSVPSLNTSGAYYHSGDMTIDNNWTLSGSESYVIFVNGNLNFTTDAHVTMPSGTFIAFIVSGNIVIDPTIGSADPTSTTGVLQGAYIANGNITVQTGGSGAVTNEKKFVGEGTFAACGVISLLRDYRNSPSVIYGKTNNSYPASLIIYRPDLVVSTPEKMKRPIINWKEIAP